MIDVVHVGFESVLFGGTVPPNGFMIAAPDGLCSVNDHGSVFDPNRILVAANTTFVTPPGYKPMGPVSAVCGGGTQGGARGW
jgi:hypothetical protein